MDARLDEVLREAVASALTGFVRLMPLHVTLVIHQDPVMTEDTVVWSLPLGQVTSTGGKIDFIPERGKPE